jgi:hypothetical protein
MKRLLLPFVVVALLAAFPFAFTSSLLAQTHFVAFLEGSEEDATFQVPAHGYAHVTLSKDRTEISYMINVWKKTEPDNPTAHFHTGARRINGPIAKHVNLVDGLVATGVWKMSDAEDPLTPALVDSLLAGRLYVNAHTLNNPGGELRGQLFQPESFFAFANPREEMPDPGKDTLFGGAAAIFVRDPINNTLYYRATANALSSTATMAHIHKGMPGETGAPVKTTVIDPSTITTTGYWTPEAAEQPFNAEQRAALTSGSLYWNIHTSLHPAGELRGQIVKPEGYLFTALLSGPSEEIGSGGEGTAVMYLSPDMDSLVTIVSAAGLSGPIVDGHIHVGQPTTDGPPVVNTSRTPFGLYHVWTATDEERPLTRADVDALFAGQYYVNLHTQKYPAGEIRGQIIPLSQEPGPARVESFQHEDVLGLSATNNPVRESTTIMYDLPYPMSVELTLIDMTGKKVWQSVQNGTKGVNNCSLSVSELSAGSYVMQVAGGGESTTMNLVVTK